MATELNSDDVSAALSLLNTAAADIQSRLRAKGYAEARATVNGYGFSLYPEGFTGKYQARIDRQDVSMEKALAHIDALPDVPVWTPSLCEQTLYAGMAA